MCVDKEEVCGCAVPRHLRGPRGAGPCWPGAACAWALVAGAHLPSDLALQQRTLQRAGVPRCLPTLKSCGSASPEDLRHGRGVGRASVGGRVRGTRCWLAGRHSQRPPRDLFAVPLCAPHGLSAPRRPQHGEYVPGAPGPSPLCAPATGWLHRLLPALALASLQPRDFVPINDRNKGRPLVPTDHPGSPASSRRRARPAALPQTRPRCGPAAGQGILSEVTGPWWRAERRPPTDVDAP